MDLVKRTALRIKLHKISGSIVHHTAVLKRALEQQGTKCQMIKGYCVIPNTKEACDHYWIREDESGYDLDVGFAVACLRTPELTALHPVLLETLPPGLIRSDIGETTILEENTRLFDLYQADPKAFWQEAPRDVSSFHVK